MPGGTSARLYCHPHTFSYRPPASQPYCLKHHHDAHNHHTGAFIKPLHNLPVFETHFHQQLPYPNYFYHMAQLMPKRSYELPEHNCIWTFPYAEKLKMKAKHPLEKKQVYLTYSLGTPQANKLFPHFQPIICAASGAIVGYEALARQFQNGRVISAGELFSSRDIPVKQLIQWDRRVRRQALEQFHKMSPNAYLTINISTVWFDHVPDLNLLPTLQMLDELNIDRNRVIIEITESKGDLNKLIKVVEVYRNHGLKVALDDFGAGFSQLERVMAIHPDIIKLDMSLFKQATKGGIANDVVQLLTRLAERSGCRIVCEGVETEDEFFFSLSCGAQYMQGYLFSAAEAEFKNPVHYQHLIESLRSKYLQKSLNKQQEKLVNTGLINELINRLRQALTANFNLTELTTQTIDNKGILRFYLCNNKGDQISPTFNSAEGKWLTEYKNLGLNWSWRPYFYELLALEYVADGYRLITSERYRDFSTGLLCKTLSVRLDQERILLVDIAAGRT